MHNKIVRMVGSKSELKRLDATNAGEQYYARFWNQKEDGTWFQQEEYVILKDGTKKDHDIIFKYIERKYPKARIIRISYC